MKFLRPERFNTDPHSPSAAKEYKHWMQRFGNFLAAIETHEPNKLHTLINYISPEVCDSNYIDGIDDYDAAIVKLDDIYKSRDNVVFARHILATRKQKSEETIDMYVQSLTTIGKIMQTLKQSLQRSTVMKPSGNALITGLSSNNIRQRLLEDENLDLAAAIAKARTLESAQRNSEEYRATTTSRIEESAITGDSISATSDSVSKYQTSVPQNNSIPVICATIKES